MRLDVADAVQQAHLAFWKKTGKWYDATMATPDETQQFNRLATNWYGSMLTTAKRRARLDRERREAVSCQIRQLQRKRK